MRLSQAQRFKIDENPTLGVPFLGSSRAMSPRAKPRTQKPCINPMNPEVPHPIGPMVKDPAAKTLIPESLKAPEAR